MAGSNWNKANLSPAEAGDGLGLEQPGEHKVSFIHFSFLY